MFRPRHVCSCILAALVCSFCVLVAHPAASEIYRWTDEQGNVHFTSDRNQVPSKYRNRTEVTELKGNIIVSGEGDTRSSAERVEEMRERSRRLVQQRPNPASREKEPQQKVRDPGPEPDKYRYNCRRRTKNGRCGRHRTAAWDKWNDLRQKQEVAGER